MSNDQASTIVKVVKKKNLFTSGQRPSCRMSKLEFAGRILWLKKKLFQSMDLHSGLDP